MEQRKQFILVGTEKPSEREEWILRIVNQLLEIDAEGVLIAFADDKTERAGFTMYNFSIENLLNVSKRIVEEAADLLGAALKKEDNEISRRFYRNICKVLEALDSIWDGLESRPE